MIEVLFSACEAASMKYAKGTWIEGTPEEVVCLEFGLDVGDIQKADDIHRKEIQHLRNLLEEGEMLRIWYSHAPYSICGFYHLSSILENYENEIRVVKLPEYQVKEDVLISYQHWGEVSSEEFSSFLSCEKTVTALERQYYSMGWSQLRDENSPLRALVNGRLLSVPESFYDFLILESIPQKPVAERELLGKLLGEHQIGIGDLWYAKRIDYFIEQGIITVIRDSKEKYDRVIYLAGKTVPNNI